MGGADETKSVEMPQNCQCPCLPKCCPENYTLSREPKLHGLSCKKFDGNLLPKVPLLNVTNDEGKQQMFFKSAFPSCAGLGKENNSKTMKQQTATNEEDYNDWVYTVHPQDTFVLKTASLLGYTLYTHQEVLDKENKTKNVELIYSNISSSMVSTIGKNAARSCTYYE